MSDIEATIRRVRQRVKQDYDPSRAAAAIEAVNSGTFLQNLRPRDVVHIRQQLLRWWSQSGEWQLILAMQGRRKLPGWRENLAVEAEQTRWWMEETFRQAELYWVSPEMTEVITQLAPSIPDTLPQPPAADAFVMFAKSIPGTDAENGGPIFTTGFLWGTQTLYKTGPSIAIETYAWRELVEMYETMDDKDQAKFREALPTRLMPTGGSEWPIGSEISDFSRLPTDNDTQQASILEDRRMLATFWALVSQKITIEERWLPDRATRRMAQRQGLKDVPSVRIIRLREPAIRAERGEGGGVDWSHRWIVGSHWRRQWYPSAGEHRPKLIEAYQKGPADKPLVVRETVRALVR